MLDQIQVDLDSDILNRILELVFINFYRTLDEIGFPKDLNTIL